MDSKIKFGIYAAVLIIASYLFAYFIDKIYYFHYSLSLITFVINIVFMIWAVNVRKFNDNNTIGFQTAIGTAFVVPVISHLAFIIFDYIFQSFIDTEMIEVAKTATIEALDFTFERMNNVMEVLGTPMADADQAEAYKAVEEMDFSPKIGMSIMSYFQKIIGSFIIAAIVALVMKNK